MNKYFFDTYSFFEIIKGSPSYSGYQDCTALTTIFHLAELNYILKKRVGRAVADRITESYRSCIIEVYLDDIKEAMDMKIKHKDMSTADVVGYVIAKRLNLKILTGDEHFRHLLNVEFVK